MTENDKPPPKPSDNPVPMSQREALETLDSYRRTFKALSSGYFGLHKLSQGMMLELAQLLKEPGPMDKDKVRRMLAEHIDKLRQLTDDTEAKIGDADKGGKDGASGH